jgi:hypothetical protein
LELGQSAELPLCVAAKEPRLPQARRERCDARMRFVQVRAVSKRSQCPGRRLVTGRCLGEFGRIPRFRLHQPRGPFRFRFRPQTALMRENEDPGCWVRRSLGRNAALRSFPPPRTLNAAHMARGCWCPSFSIPLRPRGTSRPCRAAVRGRQKELEPRLIHQHTNNKLSARFAAFRRHQSLALLAQKTGNTAR